MRIRREIAGRETAVFFFEREREMDVVGGRVDQSIGSHERGLHTYSDSDDW